MNGTPETGRAILLQAHDAAPEMGHPPVPRRLPRVRLATARDCRRELASLYLHARHGQLDAARACRLAFLLNSILHALETVDFEQRLRALESREP